MINLLKLERRAGMIRAVHILLMVVVVVVVVVVCSAGIASTVLLFKGSFVGVGLGLGVWVSSLIKNLLSPPYIYLLLNFIILSIAASSSSPFSLLLHNHYSNLHNNPYYYKYNYNYNYFKEEEEQDNDDGGDVVSQPPIPIPTPPPPPPPPPPGRPPLPSPRQHDHEQSHFTKPDGDGDGHGGDTLEGTWKAITTEGGVKQPRRSCSSNSSQRQLIFDDDDFPPRPRRLSDSSVAKEAKENDDPLRAWKVELRKSETFNDGVSLSARLRRGGLMRDHRHLNLNSLSQDELNRRVEAFIQNFNNQIRLQRQESEQRFLDMINRGV